MKKIWIDMSFVLKNKTGVGVYIITFLNELKLPNKFKFRFIFHVLWLNTLYYFIIKELTKLGYENIQRFSEFVLKKQIIEAIENMDI